ncbi:MAG: type IV toxin-antitoxin system AbiEi family antitoxin domain-containing protein [Oscillospiraceae bacterium]|jgi:predicted transcriptional regulator of viral defense system|nr:type IV toxin-antitoxin system AbiEi family antitoxin domain-containing protein [Oscillospiraceae bacterium]
MTNYDKIYEYTADNYGLITSSEAKTLGIPNVELVKLAHRGRLRRLGYGVYRIEHYVPTVNDKFAEAVTLIGNEAAIYGESVLAMHGLALVNPSAIYVAVRNRLRKTIPPFIKVIHPEKTFNVVEYEGIPSQSVFEAIITCKNIVMTDRLADAIDEAKRQGLISSAESKKARKELL